MGWLLCHESMSEGKPTVKSYFETASSIHRPFPIGHYPKFGSGPTQRAPDGWDSPREKEFFCT